MEITKSLQNLLLGTRGIQHIFITDKEGIPIIGVNESGGSVLLEPIVRLSFASRL